MTIALQDLIALFGDEGRRAAIDQLAERFNQARIAIEQTTAELDAIDRELSELGVSFHGDGESTADETESTYEEEDEERAAPVRVRRPRARPAPPADEPGDIRSSEEYVNALDEVGHELGTTGGIEIRGTDIASAMAKRGFPNRARVMAYVRAHPNWRGFGDKRARFCYDATPRESTATAS